MTDCYPKINKEVQDCQHKNDTCTRNLRNLKIATMNKMPIGIHVDTKNLIGTFSDHVPNKMDHGYFSADGVYHKL